jgi:hypothetical protein
MESLSELGADVGEAYQQQLTSSIYLHNLHIYLGWEYLKFKQRLKYDFEAVEQ